MDPLVAPFQVNFDNAFAAWTVDAPLKDNFSTRAWLMQHESWSYEQTATAEISDT